MLLVDLREFAHGAVETRAELAGDDPLFEGVDVALAGPVHVTGRLQAAGEVRFYWRGALARSSRASAGAACGPCRWRSRPTSTRCSPRTRTPWRTRTPTRCHGKPRRSISGPPCGRSCCSPCRSGCCAGMTVAGCARAVGRTSTRAPAAARCRWTTAGSRWPRSRTRSASKGTAMAVPKRRTSKRKKRARRTHYKAAPIALQPCPRCGDLKRPHHVCPTCGYYRDEQRIAVEDA